jgi:ATP synthase, Delta/Epsilon chain, beta-sandwich domain
MRRAIFNSSRRAYSASCRASFAEELDGPKHLTVNFCTPHESIFVKRQVERVTVPGEGGDVGMTFGHSPIICQLKPGILTFSNVDVSCLFLHKTAQKLKLLKSAL